MAGGWGRGFSPFSGGPRGPQTAAGLQRVDSVSFFGERDFDFVRCLGEIVLRGKAMSWLVRTAYHSLPWGVLFPNICFSNKFLFPN